MSDMNLVRRNLGPLPFREAGKNITCGIRSTVPNVGHKVRDGQVHQRAYIPMGLSPSLGGQACQQKMQSEGTGPIVGH